MNGYLKALKLGVEKWVGWGFRVFLKTIPFKYPTADENGLAFWRERILYSVLAAGTGLSIVALVPALYMAFIEGFWLLFIFDVAAFLGITCLLVHRGMSLHQKTLGVLSITFIVGVAIIGNAGFLSGGPAWLFCFAVLSGVLLGIRAALIAILLNAVTLLAIGWWSASFGRPALLESVSLTRALVGWANFLFLNAVAAISVAASVNGLQVLNSKANAATSALMDEREHLLKIRKRLRQEIVVRINSEKALHRSEQKYRLLAENIQDVIWMTDMNLAFTYVSPGIERLQGCSAEEFLRRAPKDVLAPESLNRVLDRFKALCHAGVRPGSDARSCSLEIELIRKGGDSVWVELTASFLLNENGEPIGVLGTAHDMTERLRAEKEKRSLREQLTRSKKMEALGTLAGGVAHDLNNVLSGVLSYPDLLLMDLPKSSPLRRPIEVIRDSGKKAAAIVQDLLTLARRGVPVVEVVNLNDLVREYLVSPEFLRLRSFHPFVEVESRLDPELLNIMGSPIHLSKTIMNLVSNAAEAMPEGGKIVMATENRYLDRSLQGKAAPEGDYVVFTISDTGVGIPEEDLPRIFEPFFTKKKMGHSGTGLGMAVVWGTVQDHNGHIDVRSRLGAGTQVAVFFPATRSHASGPMPVDSLDAYRGEGETVLVVDDMAEQREIATRIIGQLGYVVKSVESGERAIELLQREKVDLLILDMFMDPGMDGFTTYQHVKAIHPRQKAIIISGYAETERVRMVQQLGAGGYLKKPYTVKNLAQAIKTELNRN